MGEFGKIIDVIKQKLLQNDLESQNLAISCVLNILRHSQEETIVTQLIYNGIISNLIEVHRGNTKDVFECIEILIKSNAFYTKTDIDTTIVNIIKYELFESIEEAAMAVNILHTIATKVFGFAEFQGILLIQKYEEGFLSFLIRVVSNSIPIISATKLLNLLIKYATKEFKETHIPDIKTLYTSTMKYLINSKNVSNLEKMQNACCISISIIKFCNETDVHDIVMRIRLSGGSSVTSSMDHLPEIQEALIKSIKTTATKKIIPLTKGLELDIKTGDDFLEFLELVINLRNIKNKDICVELLSNGYLKYLLELSVLHPERYSFRVNVCRMMSVIIVALQEYLELPIYSWLGGADKFQDYICTGLESLPIDTAEWEDYLKKDSQGSNSLLILLFCHYIGTEEICIFNQASLAIKLTSVKQYIEPIFLKALWLLYSISVLESQRLKKSIGPRLHKNFVKKLGTCLEKDNIVELVYTHNLELLIYSNSEIYFPEKLRTKVITLWLDNSDSDEEFNFLISECLALGYDELKVVKLLMDIVHSNCLAKLDNAVNAYAVLLKYKKVIPEDVVELILKTLAKDLTIYNPKNLNILKTVLRFACSLPLSKFISTSIIRKCAIGIGKVVVKTDSETVLRTLLNTEAISLIRQSVEYNDSKVAEIFLKNKTFLSELYGNGFCRGTRTLKISCIRALTCLIFCQNEFDLQCETQKEVTFEDLEIFLFDLREQKCSPIHGVELIKVILRNKIRNPVIRLRNLKNNKDLKHIYNVYFLIHTIHAEIPLSEEDQIYQCLTTMLNYYSNQNLDMGLFLTSPATPLLVELAISGIFTSKRINYFFLDFSTKWLIYLKAYRVKWEIKMKSIPEETAELLVKLIPYVIKLENEDNITVKGFLKAVNDYKEQR